ncbi:MAG: type IV toxin-antitoxin system AbiEi family antitoxin domain-containing protein [Chloroflexi bacterium]|nr:type IV toxin-antitoxin system AbiEi family antitoxin domain-containing protein [Chloroflexota bacterium]
METKPDYDHLYEIAEAQAGYFTARQVQTVGFSGERLTENVKNGRFVRVARGVYRLFHFPGSPYEDMFVAWLRAGPSSVVSHESALAVYELSDILPGEVHLIVPRSASRRREGIRQHTNRLQADEITKRNGLSATTVERTLADLIANGLAEEQIRLAIREALQRGLTDREKMLQQAQRAGGKVENTVQRILSEQHEIQ